MAGFMACLRYSLGAVKGLFSGLSGDFNMGCFVGRLYVTIDIEN